MNDSLLQPGQFVADNLRVISFLGSGGMSHVYKCQDVVLSRVVAAKVLRAGFSEDSLRRFQTEGKAIARLEHSNIVKLYGLRFGADYAPVLTMEFVDGISLASLLKKEGALSISRSLRIALQIAEGLTAAQKQGIIHRDLKPANIMIINAGSLDEKVKILDFGIAKIQSDTSVKATQTGDIFGTPQYMSPEQAMGKKCDGRSDQYSLGCVLFEMLCGHPPFQQDSMVAVLIAHAQEQAPPLNKSMKNPSIRLQALVSKLMQKEPADRFESMEAVSQSIFQATTQSGVASGRLIGVALALIGIVAAVFVFNFRGIENKGISGQSLTSKASVSRPIEAPAPALGLNAEIDSSSEAALLPTTTLTDVDKTIIGNIAKYLHGEDLDVSTESISDAGLAVLAQNRNLKRVTLRKCYEITSAGVAKLKGLPLLFLDLTSTGIDDRSADTFISLTSLEELYLNDDNITSNACRQIATLQNLKHLSLRDTKIDARALTYLSPMKSLLTLDLGETNLSGSLKYLTSFSVEDLGLSGNHHWTSSDFEDGVMKMKRLRALHIDDTNISNDQLQKLSQLKDLDHISLNNCKNLNAASIIEFHQHSPLCMITQTQGVDPHDLRPSVKTSELTGQELIKNGSFEEGDTPTLHKICMNHSTVIPHWVIPTGSVDWINQKQRMPAKDANSISLYGSSVGTIAQKIPTIPGVKYCVRFKAAAGPAPPADQSLPQRLEVRASWQKLQYNIEPSQNSDKKLNWQDYAWAFRATEYLTPLQFGGFGAGRCAPCIDSVSVKKMVSQ